MKNFLKTVVVGCTLFGLCIGQTGIVFAETVDDKLSIAVTDYTVEQVVEQKLGKGTYTYEKLSSFTDPDRFILVEGDSCYLIYDNQLKDFLEYSEYENSAYFDLDNSCEKIYYSPTFIIIKIMWAFLI